MESNCRTSWQILVCSFCSLELHSLREYTVHVKLHANLLASRRAIPNCYQAFSWHNKLATHLDSHSETGKAAITLVPIETAIRFPCSISCCQSEFVRRDLLFSHLYSNIKDSDEVPCPFRGCSKKFQGQSSLRSHICRELKNNKALNYLSTPPDHDKDCVEENNVALNNLNTPPDHDKDCVEENESSEPLDSEMLDLNQDEIMGAGLAATNKTSGSRQTSSGDSGIRDMEPRRQALADGLALLLLRLESEKHVAASTVSFIIENFRLLFTEFHEIVAEELKERVAKCISSVFQPDLFKKICDEIDCDYMQDPLLLVTDPATGSLRSQYMRDQYFTSCGTVVPEQVFIGLDK